MNSQNRASRDQRGSVLFLILLAVALFAALSYAVTSSMQGGGKDGTTEIAQAGATYFISRASIIEQSLQRVRLVNNCALKNIAFDMASFALDTKTGGTNPSCNIYSQSGGGLNDEYIPAQYVDTSLMPSGYVSAGHQNTWKVDFNRGATLGTIPHNAQLVLTALYIPLSICKEINKRSGLNSPTFDPPRTSYSLMTAYQTQVGSGINGQSDAGNTGPFSLNNVGRIDFGCVEGTSSHANNGVLYWQPDGSYHFYYVIFKQ